MKWPLTILLLEVMSLLILCSNVVGAKHTTIPNPSKVTRSKMKSILQIGTPDERERKTFLIAMLTAKDSSKMDKLVLFQSGGNSHAEDKFVSYFNGRMSSSHTVTSIWLSRSPCFKCAKKLKELQNGPTHITIYVATMYKGRSDKEWKRNWAELKKLMNNGFTIEEWPWSVFEGDLETYREDNEKNLKAFEKKSLTGAINELSAYNRKRKPYNDADYAERDRKTAICIYELNNLVKYDQCTVRQKYA